MKCNRPFNHALYCMCVYLRSLWCLLVACGKYCLSCTRDDADVVSCTKCQDDTLLDEDTKTCAGNQIPADAQCWYILQCCYQLIVQSQHQHGLCKDLFTTSMPFMICCSHKQLTTVY